jgi:pimeloyl-[acyl-carrier protein] synthase
VEEILRFESPVQWTGRVAMTDVTLNGCTIYRGDLVLAGIGAANRDPAVFDEPERFNVERTENRHIAFGFGIHYCLGAMLAKLEAQMALTEFFHRFPHAAIAQKSLLWRPGLVLRCPEKLIVRPR